MSGEDLERFEDYQELDRYIEELRAGRRAQPPGGLTPEQAGIYRLAALLGADSEGEDQPGQAFTAALQARLQWELSHPPKTPQPPFPSSKPSEASRNMRPVLSRRTLVRGGATAAASLVVGAGLEATVERPILLDTSAQ